MQTTKLLFVIALGLTVLIASAFADSEHHNKGPCKGERTTTHERTTSPRHTTTEECRTTTEERTTTPRRTTTEERTTTPRRTTTEERTTTPRRTTTEECKTTTEDCRTTSEKPCDDGKCANGQWKDGKGCCPRKIDHQFYYRDFQGCYPIKRDCGVLYADKNGCYPDEHGMYLANGDCCPKERQCKPECDGNYH
jgi:hypothetical protein